MRRGYPQVRYVCEPRPGLNWARNRAIAEARGEIIAYTDDDVVVDRGWVRALAGVPELDDRITTHDFVRPRVQGGRLVLTVQPGEHGYAPFEQPDPTPCCADHNVAHERLGHTSPRA